MSFIENIRNKSDAQKIKIIWTTIAIVGVLLLVAWVLTSRVNKNLPKDTSLFQAIGNGIHNVSEQYKK